MSKVSEKDYIREDGRKVDESRLYDFSLESGLARYSHGKNLVLANCKKIVFPSPKSINWNENLVQVDARYTMTPFSTNQRFSARPYSNKRSIEISKVIKQVFESVIFLEEYAKKQIYCIADLLVTDAGTRCSAINALSYSLINSDIAHKDIPLAISFGKDINNKVVLDLSYNEDTTGLADVPFAYNINSKSVSLMQMEGDLTFEEFKLGFQYGRDELKKMYNKYFMINND